MNAVRTWARAHGRPAAGGMVLILVLVSGGLWWGINALVDGSAFHAASQFAGSKQRFTDLLGGSDAKSLSEGDAYASLALDAVYAVFYGFGLWFFLWTFWWKPFWKVARVLNFRTTVLVLPIIAMAFDLIENVLTVSGLDWTGGVHYRTDG